MAPEPERVRPSDDSPRAVFLILLAGMVAVPFAAGLVAGVYGLANARRATVTELASAEREPVGPTRRPERDRQPAPSGRTLQPTAGR